MSDRELPLALRLTAWIVTAQGVGLAVFAVAVVGEAARGNRSSTLSATLLAVIAVVWCASLALSAWGLFRARRWARAPVVLSEFLMISIGLPLAEGNERWLGVAVLASGVVGLVASLSRSVTGALTRT